MLVQPIGRMRIQKRKKNPKPDYNPARRLILYEVANVVVVDVDTTAANGGGGGGGLLDVIATVTKAFDFLLERFLLDAERRDDLGFEIVVAVPSLIE